LIYGADAADAILLVRSAFAAWITIASATIATNGPSTIGRFIALLPKATMNANQTKYVSPKCVRGAFVIVSAVAVTRIVPVDAIAHYIHSPNL
jgi:hypothetical protein